MVMMRGWHTSPAIDRGALHRPGQLQVGRISLLALQKPELEGSPVSFIPLEQLDPKLFTRVLRLSPSLVMCRSLSWRGTL